MIEPEAGPPSVGKFLELSPGGGYRVEIRLGRVVAGAGGPALKLCNLDFWPNCDSGSGLGASIQLGKHADLCQGRYRDMATGEIFDLNAGQTLRR